ncbi:hypothetical protein HC928_03530 [bacterium]|nr:hypothetical protein [bacterium]
MWSSPGKVKKIKSFLGCSGFPKCRFTGRAK